VNLLFLSTTRQKKTVARTNALQNANNARSFSQKTEHDHARRGLAIRQARRPTTWLTTKFQFTTPHPLNQFSDVAGTCHDIPRHRLEFPWRRTLEEYRLRACSEAIAGELPGLARTAHIAAATCQGAAATGLPRERGVGAHDRIRICGPAVISRGKRNDAPEQDGCEPRSRNWEFRGTLSIDPIVALRVRTGMPGEPFVFSDQIDSLGPAHNLPSGAPRPIDGCGLKVVGDHERRKSGSRGGKIRRWPEIRRKKTKDDPKFDEQFNQLAIILTDAEGSRKAHVLGGRGSRPGL